MITEVPNDEINIDHSLVFTFHLHRVTKLFCFVLFSILLKPYLLHPPLPFHSYGHKLGYFISSFLDNCLSFTLCQSALHVIDSRNNISIFIFFLLLYWIYMRAIEAVRIWKKKQLGRTCQNACELFY